MTTVLSAAVPTPPANLAGLLLQGISMFAAVALAFWGVEALWNRVFFKGSAKPVFCGHEPMPVAAALKTALVWMVPSTLVTLMLSYAVMMLAKRMGWDLPRQELIQWLASAPGSTRALIVGYALLSAPVVEEILFRRFLYRALLRNLRPLAAALASGVLFAAVHCNLVVFVPIWFLGTMLALLYWRTGRLGAPILMHMLFNFFNAAITLAYPEQA